ncbi:MAG: hypothetical protein ABR592_12870, partial [Nitriliruptorales bacterium]
PQPGGVKLTWNKAPEPDISGYRIERSTSDGGWQQVASVGPDATAYTDEAPPGEYNYRVVSRRPSGKSGEPELTTASGSQSAEVPRPSKSEEKSPGAPAPAGGTGTATGSSAGGATQNTSRGALATRVPPPPQARQGFGFSLRSLAQAFGQRQGEGEGAQEDYFGEGEGFSEELDYSGVDPVTGEPVDLPLGESIQRMLISQLTNRPLLISLAVGLLLLALAVYILRWVRRSPSPPDASQGSSYGEASQAPPSALSRFRSLFGAGGRPAPPAAEVPSPTTAPLSPRRSAQTRPLSRQEVGAAAERTATTTKPERRPAYPTTASPLFDGDRQARRNPREEVPRDETRRTSRDETPRAPRDEARQGGSVLFAQRESSATPTSGRGRSGSDGSTANVKVLRPPSADE